MDFSSQTSHTFERWRLWEWDLESDQHRDSQGPKQASSFFCSIVMDAMHGFFLQMKERKKERLVGGRAIFILSWE